MIGVAVSTRDLVKRYGRRAALDGFTLSVPQGAVLGLVGANGAGKTTWMMTVAGLIQPTSGKIDLLGGGAFNADLHSGRISILPQDSELPLEATPADLLYRYGRLQGLSASVARESATQVLKSVNLADRAHDAVRTLSHGMRKRAMLAQCFIGSPELILLDEPLNGLDPAEQDRMRAYISSHRGRQTLIVSSHNLNDIEILCTHVAFVEKGRVTRVSTVRSLTQESGHLEYGLARVPEDRTALIAALSAALPEARFTWRDQPNGGALLVCSYDAAKADAAKVNKSLLPVLVAHVDVLSVSCGRSLEEAFLHGV